MSEFVVLGCVCFGFKLLPEKLFRKCGCLVAYGKWIFRKKILVYHKIKAFDPESIFSQNFTFKSFPETHKERKDSHAQTERERERERDRELRKWRSSHHRRDRQPEIVEPINSELHELTNPRMANPRAHERRTHDPRTVNPRSDCEPTNYESHRADRTGKSHCY